MWSGVSSSGLCCSTNLTGFLQRRLEEAEHKKSGQPIRAYLKTIIIILVLFSLLLVLLLEK